MRRLLAILFALPLAAAGPAAETARAIRENAFDREECYRVRDITLIRHDIRIYLTDGYLIFSKPVMGRRVGAVFTADMQGGDGEVIVMPPNRGERRALASFTGSPNLNEHFRSAVFLGGGDLYGEFKRQMGDNPTNRRLPEMGAALEDRWAGVLRNLSASHETRLTYDLLSGAAPGECLFTGIFGSTRRGNFDVVYDPRMAEQVTVGQVANRDGRTFFDIWTSFESRNKGPRSSLFGRDAALTDYRIDASIGLDLDMTAVTRVKVRPAQDGLRVIALDIAREMTVHSATVDGRDAEVLRRESLRGNLARGGNEMFLVVPPEPLRAGRDYEFEIRHRGKVVHDAGDRVYYVSARGNFYPAHGLQYATYDLRFRYARDLNLVSAGDILEDSTEGEWRTTRRRTQAPVRMAGFNLGSYLSAKASKGNYTVEVFANHNLERALQPKQVMTPVEIPQVAGPRRPVMPQFPSTDPGPSPAMHLRRIATEIADAMDFMAGKFGAPALPSLTVSPIPGTFGQGFPGLIYLSTLTYLKGTASARARMTPHQETFYSEILQAHEAAHQWWGNVVSAEGYQDNWLMEALANYSALLYLESRKGPRFLTQTLDQLRGELLEKNPEGKTVDSAGPIVLGTRLENSLEPRAWRAITYGKGSWIVHMLRRLMGDEPFFRMLAGLRVKYERQQISTEEFREFAAAFLPPKSDDPRLELFFDQWVYSTGVPLLRMTHSIKGKAPAWRVTGTVTQTEVNNDFTALVPVEVQVARGKSVVHWVRTSNEPEEFSIPLRQAPLKVTLDPNGSVLRR